jgi:hypothetical protein
MWRGKKAVLLHKHWRVKFAMLVRHGDVVVPDFLLHQRA